MKKSSNSEMSFKSRVSTNLFWYFTLTFAKIKRFPPDFSPGNTYLSLTTPPLKFKIWPTTHPPPPPKNLKFNHPPPPPPPPPPPHLLSVIWPTILNWSWQEFSEKKNKRYNTKKFTAVWKSNKKRIFLHENRKSIATYFAIWKT